MPITPEELLAVATSPIRPDKPGGDPVTYEPDFEAIKVEIAKIDSLKGEIPAWSQVQENCLSLLKTKGKDLTVASYLLLSLFKNDSYAGLAAGLHFYRELIDKGWETLYPEMNRMRGRVAAVSWLDERASAAVTRKAPSGGEVEAVKACVEALAGVVGTVEARFTAGEVPSLGDLRRSLDEAARAAAPSPAAAQATAFAAAAGGPAAVDSVDAALRVLRNLGGEVRRAVEFLVKTDPASPVPYLASRGIAWALIRELPPDKDGVTQFPAPDPSISQNWEKLVEGGQWPGLLADTEWRLINAPLWLDIDYHVALALENLGHDAARQAVVDQTVALVRRFPRLLELQYQSGQPFAGEGARGWIRAEMAVLSGGGEGGAIGEGGAPATDPFAEGSREARALAARGRINEAVRFVQERIDGGGGARDRFRWRLLLAGICLDAGQTAVAGVQLNRLDEEVQAHRLEDWDPELSLDVLRMLYRCEKKLGQSGHRDAREAAQRLDRLYERLCRIDILSALSLEGKK